MIKFKRASVQLFFIFILGLSLGYALFTSINKVNLEKIEKNTPKAFVSEVYDKIKENYWDNLSDAQILELFKLSYTQNGGQITASKFENKEELLKTISDSTKGMNTDEKTKFTTSVANSVLVSLNPAGRSGLYTQKLEEQLKNTVENVNPEKDLYKDLGLAKGASEEAVEKAYEQQSEQLRKENTTESEEKLKRLSYAKDVLTTQEKKERYDQKGVEPTVFSEIIRPAVLYVQFKKFSPTSYDEFIKAFETHKDNSSLSALIFDLRGNVGGAIDATALFLGHFIGKNAYAYDFYHKGEYLPFKTQTEKLPSIIKYKQVVILTDNATQSSAELMASSLKKYHAGVVVGAPTKGWGTVEKVFPLDNQISTSEKFSLFLVHSITIRDDNLPIEGRGVEPDVNIKSANWEEQLFSYVRNQPLIEAVKKVI